MSGCSTGGRGHVAAVAPTADGRTGTAGGPLRAAGPAAMSRAALLAATIMAVASPQVAAAPKGGGVTLAALACGCSDCQSEAVSRPPGSKRELMPPSPAPSSPANKELKLSPRQPPAASAPPGVLPSPSSGGAGKPYTPPGTRRSSSAVRIASADTSAWMVPRELSVSLRPTAGAEGLRATSKKAGVESAGDVAMGTAKFCAETASSAATQTMGCPRAVVSTTSPMAVPRATALVISRARRPRSAPESSRAPADCPRRSVALDQSRRLRAAWLATEIACGGTARMTS